MTKCQLSLFFFNFINNQCIFKQILEFSSFVFAIILVFFKMVYYLVATCIILQTLSGWFCLCKMSNSIISKSE